MQTRPRNEADVAPITCLPLPPQSNSHFLRTPMSKMLDAFKIKPYDLEPVYAAWPDCPRFLGIAKKDPPVDEWLDQIKAGCTQRNVPKEYWHRLAQHYMGDKAKARFASRFCP